MYIGILTIHGVGSQKKEFAAPFQKLVKSNLDKDAEQLIWQDILWADLLLGRENRLWKSMQSAQQVNGEPFPLDYSKTREFLVHNVGDALAYNRMSSMVSFKGNAYDLIHNKVGEELDTLLHRLKENEGNQDIYPIIVIAHSLGATIMSDYIWDRQQSQSASENDSRIPIETLAGFITFGSTIPLFCLGYEHPVPIDFPISDDWSDKQKKAIRWLNFVDRDDVLGWPLKSFYSSSISQLTNEQKRITLSTTELIEDYEINVGGGLSSWNPLCHQKYWTDKDFVNHVSKYLKTILEAFR